MQTQQAIRQASYLENLTTNAVAWGEVSRMIEEAKTPPTLAMKMAKSVIDKIAVLTSLPFVLPLFAIIAVAIKLDSKGSIFFKQKRTGLDGSTFEIFKFRTMTEAAGTDSKASQSQKEDMRHTRVGRLLRRTSMDELPQIINIVRGEMSLIGPRPHARYHDKLFLNSVPGYAQRFRVKPGLTGWAQVHGCRGFIDCHKQIASRTEYDNDYINNWSLKKEISILFKTVWVVVKGENAY